MDCCEKFLEMIEENPDAIIITSDEAHFYRIFTAQEESISKTVDTGQVKILITCTKNHCTVKEWQCGALLELAAFGGPYFFEDETVT